MSLQRRLALSVSLVLVISLLMGAGLTYRHVVAKVATETRAALAVGARTAANALGDTDDAIGPAKKLRLLVRDFDGDRHVQAVLHDPAGQILAQSKLLPPDDPAPHWFYRLAISAPLQSGIAMPEALRSAGTLTLVADAHNEVSEAWDDLCLTMEIMAVFFGLVMGMSFLIIRAAIEPLRAFCGALARIGSGDYATRFHADVYQELIPVRDGFNEMAARLETVEAQNHALNEQLLSVQEEERTELARDLHDEIAPFLFAVGADAAMIRKFVSMGKMEPVATRAGSIAESVRHMQKHVRNILRRLAPDALLNLGLPSAIDNLAAFWKMRCPRVTFDVDVEADLAAPPLDRVIFRIVQESFSNAIRHGNPSLLTLRIHKQTASICVRIEDDGAGFPAGVVPAGFGTRGMSDRVSAAGGAFKIQNRAQGRGVLVEATFPTSEPVTEPDAAAPDIFA